MPLLTKLINVFFARRRKEIDFFMEHPQQVQQQQLKWLLNRAENTVFGRKHGFRLSVLPRSLLLWSQLLITIHFRAISPESGLVNRTCCGLLRLNGLPNLQEPHLPKASLYPSVMRDCKEDTCRGHEMYSVSLPICIRKAMFLRARR